MARKLAVYVGHESARMAELEGAPLASFSSRAVAFAIDFAVAALTFVPVGMGGAIVAIRLGWLHDHVHIQFDPFHHENWASLIYYVLFIGVSNYIGNGATIGKKIMRIRAVSLVHRRLTLWDSLERALGYGASALEAFFGFFQYFIHPAHRTVHDRIAETIVVSGVVEAPNLTK
ncbi:MAG TPA: RDD family protein [Acidisarcina sp.]